MQSEDVGHAAWSMGRMGRPRTEKLDPASRMKDQMSRRLKAALLACEIDKHLAAKLTGVSLKAWEAYESGQNMVPALVAYRFYVKTNIPMEWIYAGDVRRVEYDLAQKLIQAAAEVGAVVGGVEAEFPMQTERAPAYTPRPPGRRHLHED